MATNKEKADEEKADKELRARREEKIKLLKYLIPELTVKDNHPDTYPATVALDTFNLVDKTSLTLGLNSTKKIALGDNVSVTLLGGTNVDVNLTLDGVWGGIESAGKARVSFSGIAKSLILRGELLSITELDSVKSNKVTLPNFDSLVLPYGNINTVASKRLLGVEFMRPEKVTDNIVMSDCDFANFRLITKNPIKNKDLKTIPLVDSWASDDPKVGKYLEEGNLFEGCSKVRVPDALMNDIGIEQGKGVNIVQYQSGLGRIAYEEMEGISKSVVYATDQYSNFYCKGAKFTVICAPHSSESIITINTSNSYIRVLNTSLTAVAAIDFGTTLQMIKVSPSVIGLDMSSEVGLKIRTYNGVEIANAAAASLATNVLHIVNDNVTIADQKLAFGKTGLCLNLIDLDLEYTDFNMAYRATEIGSGESKVCLQKITLMM